MIRYEGNLAKFLKHAAPLMSASLVAVVTALMLFLGIRATNQWERTTQESMESRSKEALSLLIAALDRDMKGGSSALVPFNQFVLGQSSPYDLADRFAALFARFPYIESFFVWKSDGSEDGQILFFNRTERLPGWDEQRGGAIDPYPVAIRENPPPTRPVVAIAREQAAKGIAFAPFENETSGVRYQGLVHLIYSGTAHAGLWGAVGFTVNMAWVRQDYFGDLIRQVQKISGDPTIAIEIRDAQGQTVAHAGPTISDSAYTRRMFRLAFSDRAVLSSGAFLATAPAWTAMVGIGRVGSVLAARAGGARTLDLLGLSAFVAFVALVLATRAAQAEVQLATRQSEFVTAVTHEMKTPLSSIVLTSDSLAQGRYASERTVTEYGRIIGAEARQLTRLIDNVLHYARLINTADSPAFERVDIVELVAESVERFGPHVSSADVDVDLDLPVKGVNVRADRRLLQDALDNVIDNAVKHGGAGNHLRVAVCSRADRVVIQIADSGAGIPPEDLPRIFEKFYRGRNANARGSGLGLTITRRIVNEHAGTIHVQSTMGRGTLVEIELPAEPVPQAL